MLGTDRLSNAYSSGIVALQRTTSGTPDCPSLWTMDFGSRQGVARFHNINPMLIAVELLINPRLAQYDPARICAICLC